MRHPIKIEHLVPTKWGWMVSYPEGLVLPMSADIGAFCYLQAKYGIHIGENVEIGSHCSIYSHSTIDGKKGLVRIGDNANIGTHSTITPGVTVGKDALIGAHSFVNKDIPDGARARGCPVKIIGEEK